MTRKVWGLIVVAFIVIVVILVVFRVRHLDGDKIAIGVVGPFTGEVATYGDSMRRGFELATQGKTAVKLIYEDDMDMLRETVGIDHGGRLNVVRR